MTMLGLFDVLPTGKCAIVRVALLPPLPFCVGNRTNDTASSIHQDHFLGCCDIIVSPRPSARGGEHGMSLLWSLLLDLGETRLTLRSSFGSTTIQTTRLTSRRVLALRIRSSVYTLSGRPPVQDVPMLFGAYASTESYILKGPLGRRQLEGRRGGLLSALPGASGGMFLAPVCLYWRTEVLMTRILACGRHSMGGQASNGRNRTPLRLVVSEGNVDRRFVRSVAVLRRRSGLDSLHVTAKLLRPSLLDRIQLCSTIYDAVIM